MISTAAADLALPYLFGLGLDVINPDSGRSFLGRTGMPALDLLIPILGASIVVRFFSYYGQTYFTSWIGQRVVYDLRSSLFRHLQRLSIRYIDQRGVGSPRLQSFQRLRQNLRLDPGGLPRHLRAPRHDPLHPPLALAVRRVLVFAKVSKGI